MVPQEQEIADTRRFTYEQVTKFIEGWPEVPELDLFTITGWTFDEFEIGQKTAI